ncbi:MAG: DedA family protein [Acidobacteria bacterium]|nr:DedA family protein [Acidobacteriota bacterium]
MLGFLREHGYWVVSGLIFVEFLGMPFPSFPVLLLSGALAASGELSLLALILFASVSALLADGIWYAIGQRHGRALLRTLCRATLNADRCVIQTEGIFSRYGGGSLLFAKFVPGLSTLAAPMAGMLAMSRLRFLALDAAGTVAWATLFVVAGALFRDQIEAVVRWLEQLRHAFLVTLVLLASLYGAIKVILKRRMARWPGQPESPGA